MHHKTVLLGLYLFSGVEGMGLAPPALTCRCPDGTGGTLPYKSCYLLSQHLKGPANGGWLPCICTCRPCSLYVTCRSLPRQYVSAPLALALAAETSLEFLFRGTEQTTGFATAMHAGFVSAAGTAAPAPAPEAEELSPPPARKLPRPVLFPEPSTGPLVAAPPTAEQLAADSGPQPAIARQPPATRQLPAQPPPPPAQEAAPAGLLDKAGAPAWPGAGWSAPPPALQQGACAAFPQSLPAGDVIVSYNTPLLDVCCWRCAQEPQCSAFAFCPADRRGVGGLRESGCEHCAGGATLCRTGAVLLSWTP